MKIACVQMKTPPGRANENFARAEALVRRAAEKERPDVILLPETWNTGFAPERIDPAQADEDGARTNAVFSGLAKELGVNILAGSVTAKRDGGLYNTAYGFDRAGNRVCAYDKTHLFSPMGEDRVYRKGGAPARFTLDGASCALIICYDLRFPEWVRTLALPGLDVLFVVSQWPKARVSHLEALITARAIENQTYVALCNACGKTCETVFGGHSAVIGPLGKTLVRAGFREEIVSAEADTALPARIRAEFPAFYDRRPELYHADE